MEREKLKEILELHKMWLNNESDGVKANLSGANLRNTYLSGADLSNIKINEFTIAFLQSCPEEGNFTAYKKASGKIVVLEIPADAKRSSATTLKCRCDKAKVLRIEELDGTLSDTKEIASDNDKKFIYKVGEIVSVEDFDDNRWNECSHGIHFFINKELARQY